MADRVDGEVPRGDIQVIARVASLLEGLTPGAESLDAQRAATILGVGRSTAHRYLVSMEKAGLLRRRDAATFEVGPALTRLGAMAIGGVGIVEAAGPRMQELAATIRATVVLSVWGGSAPIVARVVPDASRATTVSIEVGRSLEPESAQAKVFAAYHRRQKEGGWDRTAEGLSFHPTPDSSEPVVSARHVYAKGALKVIAAPVLAHGGQIVATVAALGLTAALPDAKDDDVTARLLHLARELRR